MIVPNIWKITNLLNHKPGIKQVVPILGAAFQLGAMVMNLSESGKYEKHHNDSLTWILRPFGDDFPCWPMIPSEVTMRSWLNFAASSLPGVPCEAVISLRPAKFRLLGYGTVRMAGESWMQISLLDEVRMFWWMMYICKCTYMYIYIYICVWICMSILLNNNRSYNYAPIHVFTCSNGCW